MSFSWFYGATFEGVANPSLRRRHAFSKCVDGRSIQLGQRVSDREPRRLRLHQDVSLGSTARIVVEYPGLHLDPWAFPLWIGHRRAAAAAKGCAIRRRPGAKGSFVPLDQLFALDKAEILAQHAQPGHEG